MDLHRSGGLHIPSLQLDRFIGRQHLQDRILPNTGSPLTLQILEIFLEYTGLQAEQFLTPHHHVTMLDMGENAPERRQMKKNFAELAKTLQDK